MSGPDKLFNLRNQFWLGNYTQVQSLGSSLPSSLSAELRVERDAYVYRALIALREFHVVLDEVADSSTTPIDLRAVKALALYMSNPVANADSVMQSLRDWMADEGTQGNATLRLVVGIVFGQQSQFVDALRAVAGGDTMEMRALEVQLLLRMDRPDVAEKRLRAMQQADEDHTLAQLAAVWVAVAQGGPRCQEALYQLQDLRDRYGSTSMLLNAMGVCQMHLGEFEEAERLLADATSSGDPDVLVNVVACAQQRRKPQNFVDRYVNQLKASAPQHPFVQSCERMEGAFDRVAAGYAQ